MQPTSSPSALAQPEISVEQLRWFVERAAALATECRQRAASHYCQTYNREQGGALLGCAQAIEANLEQIGWVPMPAGDASRLVFLELVE